jgi:hypothetical protein
MISKRAAGRNVPVESPGAAGSSYVDCVPIGLDNRRAGAAVYPVGFDPLPHRPCAVCFMGDLRRRPPARGLILGIGCPRHRANHAAQALIPPFRLTNWSRGSDSDLYAAAYRMSRDHLLRVRLSALAESAVHRMTAANGSSRSDTSSRCKRRARRARSSSRPSAAHQATRP